MIGAARELPSDPGNASRFRPALRLASSGVARTPARMAQGIVGQTSDHEIRRFPMQLPSLSICYSPSIHFHHDLS